jgi:hypothetical protein
MTISHSTSSAVKATSAPKCWFALVSKTEHVTVEAHALGGVVHRDDHVVQLRHEEIVAPR